MLAYVTFHVCSLLFSAFKLSEPLDSSHAALFSRVEDDSCLTAGSSCGDRFIPGVSDRRARMATVL